MSSLRAVIVAALVASVSGCTRDTTVEWHQAADHRWRALDVRGGTVGFTRMNRVDFQNEVSDSLLRGNRVLAQGAGVALGDVDGDGLVDVFLARTQGCNVLYRNRGGWRFADVTARAGVGACDRFSSAATLADVDADADLDLILLATTGPNAVYLNDGTGVFAERRDLGLDTTGRGGTAISLADIDGDRSLEMFIANYRAWHVDDSIPPQRRSRNQVVRQRGPNQFEIAPEHRESYRLVFRPDMGGMRVTTLGAANELYALRDGRFRKVPLSAGVMLDSAGRPLGEAAESFSLGARFADFNSDGAPDLYVANDFEDHDELWLNDGRGRLRRAPWVAQRQMSNSAMGLDVADVDGDGTLDFFVVDMLANDSRRLKTQLPTHTALPKRTGDVALQLQQQRNTLFLNRGDGTFSEVAQAAGVGATGWSWSTVFTDVDLDGWQDILVANGHLWDIMDADTHERLQRMQQLDWRRVRWEFPRLPLRNVAFRNRGDVTFEDASATWRFGEEDDVSHAIALGDLDGDGDHDVVVNRLRAPALLLRNDAPAPRVSVRLVGDAPNTRAVGARIRLTGGAIPLQEREVAAGGVYLSHSDYAVVFGMGRSDSATLQVDWPDGRRTIITGVRPNRAYEVDTRSARTVPQRQELEDPSGALFEDATAALGGHRHEDPPFDDWKRQLLLVNSLSELGPGAAWSDLDGDGDEDLVIGAGKGGRLAVLRNERGKRFATWPARPLIAPGDVTGLVTIADDAAGSHRVLAGISRWEGGMPPSVVAYAARRGLPQTDTIVPATDDVTGPLALADYDSDGDLDLFVGARARPAQYPRAVSSTLYRNDDGTFVPLALPALHDVGLVSASTFADMDADGDPDLLLAREWDSILLLVNDRGQFRHAQMEGLGRWTSRWNGIATGDLDGDGRLDIVATSWGRNTMLQADEANPLVLIHGAFGLAGEEEMLIARHDPRIGALAPLNGYQRLRAAIPDFSQRVRTFNDYAEAPVDRVLGPWLPRVTRKAVNTLSHYVFLNRGVDFEAVELPWEAQLAPAFHASVADFDGDGAEDVFLAQNFSPTASGLPRYDAGRGLLLRGDGRGGLTPLPGARSGIAIYGDQRGAAHADYDGDGRLDLVVPQNSGPTRLLHNRGGATGLRVRLHGRPGNRDGIGAQMRLIYGDRHGPVREVQAGSGYWSQNSFVQVLGLSQPPSAVWVRWPGGAEQVVGLAQGAREVTIVKSPR